MPFLRSSLLVTLVAALSAAAVVGCAASTGHDDSTEPIDAEPAADLVATERPVERVAVDRAALTIARPELGPPAAVPCAGSFILETNGYKFDLLLTANAHGDVLGAMLPKDGNPSADGISRIEGTCDGRELKFTRSILESGLSQQFTGLLQGNGRDWSGVFRQSGFEFATPFKATRNRDVPATAGCSGAWDMSANTWPFALVLQEQGDGRVLGVMLPNGNVQSPERLEGTCGPQGLEFVRYMSGWRKTQGYHGTRLAAGGWGGTFKQAGVGEWPWTTTPR